MAKGGSTPQTQTTTSVLSPEQQELMQLAMPGVRQFAASVPKRYSGTGIAGFDPAQTAGQEMALAAAGQQQGVVAGGANASNYWTSGNVWEPENNPALRGAIDASVRPITEQYLNTVLPSIRSEADRYGQFGSTRHQLANTGAARDYMRTVGDTSSKLVNNAYDTNVNAQLKALGLLPQTAQALTIPAMTTSGVGDVRQALAQAQLSENIQGFNYDQLAPFLQSKEIMSLLPGLPGGSTVSMASTPQPNRVTGALGGAAAGAALGSMFLPGIGTAAGAGLGALLPFIS